MKSKTLRIVCFIGCLIVLLFGINEILKYKSNDGIDQMQAFYTNEENTIDVLFMGSSHSYSNINTSLLYKDFGIAGFDLGGAEQLLWNNYFWLVEALKTQKPKVIVLEVFSTGVIKDDFQGAWMMENIYGMKPSSNYYESVKQSTMDNAFNSYILPFTRYHSKYTQISKEDFQYNEYLQTFKGFEPKWGNANTEELVKPDISYVTDQTPISEKAERYFRKYIELCQKENIPLVLVCSPYMVTEDAQKIYNYMFSIAEQYSVPYLDFNKMYDELQLDFKTDMCEWSHLNEKGNVKYSTYLGSYLKDNYEIPDRREDEKYSTWQQAADIWTQELNEYTLIGINDAATYLDKLNNSYYTIIVTQNQNNDISKMSDNVKNKLEVLGINISEFKEQTTVIKDKTVLFHSSEEEYEWYTSLKKGDIIVSREKTGGEDHLTVQINGSGIMHTGKPIIITVYDNLLNKRIAMVGLTPEDGYSKIW